MEKEELQSAVINLLRFPLIVGVIFIHNYKSTMVVQGVEIGCNSMNMPIYYLCSEFFSKVIGSISVPLFFFISGYLFFLKIDFGLDIYLNKLKKRMHTLLIPYLFWNITFLLAYFLVSYIPEVSVWFKEFDFSLSYIFSGLWAQNTVIAPNPHPIAPQFWFIRDLMVVVVLSPLIFYYLKYFKKWGVIILALLWLWDLKIPYWGERGFSTVVFLFFSAGAWYSINKKNILECCFSSNLVCFFIWGGYPLLAIWDLCTKNELYNIYIHKIGIVMGILFMFLLASYLIEKRKVHINKFLASASFFIFAIHDPWLLTQIRKVMFRIFKPETDIILTMFYFLMVFLTVVIALLIYYLLRQLLPRFTAVITGGR